MHAHHQAIYSAKVALLGLAPTPRWVWVSIAQQHLYLYDSQGLALSYPCSTSIRPPSCQYGSEGTPLGLHRIADRIGDGVPLGGVFTQRVFTGEIYSQQPPSDKSFITSRILWLDGLEENKNLGYTCGSHNRKIYIHGTNEENKIGTPASCGCINLRNADIIELYARLQTGDHVMID